MYTERLPLSVGALVYGSFHTVLFGDDLRTQVICHFSVIVGHLRRAMSVAGELMVVPQRVART